ncbi:Pre-mRNA-splicing factor of RES complex [Nesidiocoris tenuis]|uniref:BUD13 homolog n=1 Tax=Nesidiocoris tenuis TaxID=355587 RepID=A0ABN7AAY8_9HEMI|nr:Pre-mRNA-splicing factor of RES complex [Nesidiocoris tenuis]
MEKQPKPVLSQKEYLQRYLSKESKKTKKKKNKQPAVSSSKHLKRSVIIDDDINLNDLPSSVNHEDDVNLDHLGDEAPQVVGFVDERPEEIKLLEKFKSGQWTALGAKAAEEDAEREASQSERNRTSHARNAPDDNDDSDLELQRKTVDKSAKYSTKSRRQDRAADRSDSDIELPRKKDGKFGAGGPNRAKDRRRDRDNSQSDSDMELPRKRSKNNSSKKESDRRFTGKPTRKQHGSDEDSDLDVRRPARKGKKGNVEKKASDTDSDLEVPRKTERRGGSDSDLDVSRQRKAKESNKHSRGTDYQKLSNPRTQRTNSNDDSDQELPRERSRKDKSEKRSKYKRDSSSDEGTKSKEKSRYQDSRDKAQRKYKEKKDTEENTVSRRKHGLGSDMESQRKRRTHGDSDSSDLDVPRKKRGNPGLPQPNDDSDLSPPRKDKRRSRSIERPGRKNDSKNLNPTDSKPRRDEKRKDRKAEENRLEKMQDGKKAGLQDAKSLKDELRLLKDREDQMYREMDPELLGKSAEAVVRDRRTGARRDFEKERRIEAEKAAKSAVRQKKYDRWGKGLKQVQDQEERLVDMAREMSKPFARYADDDDLEKALKAQEREGDPMLDYIRNHQKESHTIDLTGSGGVRKKYAGSFPPNRFNIGPGHRWDGVDRSNGYEQKWFAARNAKKAGAEEAWKWSSADM